MVADMKCIIFLSLLSTFSSAAAFPSRERRAGDPQSSNCLDPSVIQKGSEQDGTNATGSTAGQAPSLTSTNNFINFCLGKTLTNGQQVQGGSCNPVPMGDIPTKNNIPSCRIQSPQNGASISANTAFDVSLQIQGLQTGTFTNPDATYYSAPQQLNTQGQIIGHSHIVIQQVASSSDVPDPKVFAFFKGLNSPAQQGILTTSVTKGLPPGQYRISTINTAGNHQPALAPVAQHGSLDDAIYITVAAAQGGSAANNNTAANGSVAGANNATNGTTGNNAANNTNTAANGTSTDNAAANSTSAANGTATNGTGTANGTAANGTSAANGTATNGTGTTNGTAANGTSTVDPSAGNSTAANNTTNTAAAGNGTATSKGKGKGKGRGRGNKNNQ